MHLWKGDLFFNIALFGKKNIIYNKYDAIIWAFQSIIVNPTLYSHFCHMMHNLP